MFRALNSPDQMKAIPNFQFNTILPLPITVTYIAKFSKYTMEQVLLFVDELQNVINWPHKNNNFTEIKLYKTLIRKISSKLSITISDTININTYTFK